MQKSSPTLASAKYPYATDQIYYTNKDIVLSLIHISLVVEMMKLVVYCKLIDTQNELFKENLFNIKRL